MKYILTTIIIFAVFLNSVEAGLIKKEAGELDAINFSGQAGYDVSMSIDPYLGYIISVFIEILGILFLGLALYGGYTYMLARGNEEQVDKGVGMIRQAIYGLIITMGAFAIWKYIFEYLLK